MKIIFFFAPPAAFFSCVLLGVIFHKNWAGTLAASAVFYAATFAVMAVLGKILERKQNSN
jgi:hypothetical protein